MIGITEISAVVAALGVIIGVIYYILEIRHEDPSPEPKVKAMTPIRGEVLTLPNNYAESLLSSF